MLSFGQWLGHTLAMLQINTVYYKVVLVERYDTIKATFTIFNCSTTTCTLNMHLITVLAIDIPFNNVIILTSYVISIVRRSSVIMTMMQRRHFAHDSLDT